MLRLALSFLLLGTLPLLSLQGCGGPQKAEIKPGKPIPGLKMSGLWYSAEFGYLKLVQDGNILTGTYEDPRGADHNGTLRGNIQNDLVRLEWVKPGNPTAAIMPQRGRAWLRIVDQGKRMRGRWGYDESDDDGGPWNAEKSQYD